MDTLLWAFFTDGGLAGIYSSRDKAIFAAEQNIKLRGGTWFEDEREHEIQWNCKGVIFVVDRWQLDRALLADGKWKAI